jgi:asparagine synthase (glutamine-hydrolysing)
MCGIFGHTKPVDNLKASKLALDRLSHRGPDQWGEWHNSDVYIGHRRLSIMDLSENGRQPMEGKDVVIAVNGEIYNFAELKKQLLPKYKFKSNSDSEVLIYGYIEWGMKKLLNLIEGMYAFVLYDQKNHKLYLARDRVGIKPLYYSRINGQISWASELKALTEFHKSDSLEVDSSAIYDYLTYLYIPTPKTMYKNIFKLEAAHYLEVNLTANKVQKKCYWQLGLGQSELSINEASSRLKELVSEAVEQQLMSDVPVGFFLSGGLDSSTVVATAAKLIGLRNLNTYSIGFDIKEHDETHFADILIKKFKANHQRKELSVNEVKKDFKKIREWYDEPFADTSAFPTHLVSRIAKDSSTVVLTGDGGDEVFGGYNWYRQFKDGVDEYINVNFSKSKFRKAFRKLKHRKDELDLELEYYSTLLGGFTREQKSAYRQQFNIPEDYDDHWHFKKFYKPDLPIYTRCQYLDFHTYLPDDILTKVDRASMAVALECRVPLLSTKLIEFIFSLPEDVRYLNGELKGLMKYAFKDILPDEILKRDKKGFSIPTGKWAPDLLGQKIRMQEFILKELYPELLR